MSVPNQCPRCGYSYLTEKEFLYRIDLSCQKCGWSEEFPYPNDNVAQTYHDLQKS